MQPKKQSPSPPVQRNAGRWDGVGPRIAPSSVDPQQRATEHDPVHPPRPAHPAHRAPVRRKQVHKTF